MSIQETILSETRPRQTQQCAGSNPKPHPRDIGHPYPDSSKADWTTRRINLAIGDIEDYGHGTPNGPARQGRAHWPAFNSDRDIGNATIADQIGHLPRIGGPAQVVVPLVSATQVTTHVRLRIAATPRASVSFCAAAPCCGPAPPATCSHSRTPEERESTAAPKESRPPIRATSATAHHWRGRSCVEQSEERTPYLTVACMPFGPGRASCFGQDSVLNSERLGIADSWGGWGSNPRPRDYESLALTG
jgi:hypothetical protein